MRESPASCLIRSKQRGLRIHLCSSSFGGHVANPPLPIHHPLLVPFSYAEPPSTSGEQRFGTERALVGQEAFLVHIWKRIAKHVVAAGETARRATTVSKRAVSTVMDHRPGGSATKSSLGGAMHPLSVGFRRPSQNCDRGHRSHCKVFHGYFPFTRMTVGCPRDDRANSSSTGHQQ